MKIRIFLGVAASAVLLFGQTRNPYNSLPTRTVGHARQTPVTTTSPNFLEGREMFSPQGIAADTSTNPPILYVADTGNNRVLAWRNPSAAEKGAFADRVIGQRDFLTTLPQGPESANIELRIAGGFNAPTGVAVDRSGNLYVADSGNNRVVRYPKPFEQTSEILQADLVIGQRSVTQGRQANQGIGPDADSLALSAGSPYRVGLAFDASSNLWVSDPGNNRVLRFPAAQLDSNNVLPKADLVLGQPEFNKSTVTDPQGTAIAQLSKGVLVQPSGMSFDAQGRLFICDARNRVTMWVPPFRTGMMATRVLGYTNELGVNARRLGVTGVPPEGVFTIGNEVYVVDTGNNRILRFGNPESWPEEAAPVYSPAALSVIGQPDFVENEPNRDVFREARPDAFFLPISVAVAGGYWWIVDSANNRILGMQQSAPGTADRVLGQLDFQYRGPNITKPNGFNFTLVAGVAVDYNANPPRLYVSDSGNHRILGYRDARNIKTGAVPDLIIGQQDYYRNSINYGTGDPNRVIERGLNSPAGVAVDADGNLWVADTGNGRVMRFPRPFDQPVLNDQRANLCLGQANCFARPQREATARTMSAPVGIAFMVNGSVMVSDPAHNRVLQYRKPEGGDFTDGQAAALVIGQREFSFSAPGNEPDRLNSPRFITVDSSDRLYIADNGNNRLFIRALVGLNGNGAQASYLLSTSAPPTAVTVSRETGNIWVTFPTASQMVRYAEYTALVFDPSPQPQGDVIPSFGPLALALDPQDNPIVTEAIHRVALYFPRLDLQNAANQNRRLIAPGMVAKVSRFAGSFGDVSGTAPDKAWPTDLGDIEVTVDDVPAPLRSVAFDQIRFQVPTTFDPPKPIEIIVRRKETGQVLGALTVPTEVASPGFFAVNDQGFGQVVAQNQDGTENSSTNGATRGSTVRLFGTGIGKIPNMPPDGQAPDGEVPAGGRPTVVFNGRVLAAADIKYFGLAPGLVGTFRLDVVVPANAAVNLPNPVGIEWRDLLSRDGFPAGVNVTVFVR